ncbi:MAG: hypothetical protein ACO1TE_18555 [Prosthecobacter sp.]
MKSASLLLLLAAPLASAADAPPPKPKPEFQYKSEGIAVSIPTAGEAKVAAFNAATIQAASKYLDDGAVTWVREKSCINCHTTGPYMAERPALSALLGRPNEEIQADFITSIPAPANDSQKAKKRVGASTSVWCTMGLAEWDKHVTGKLSEHTGRALREMMTRQADNGSFVSTGEVEIPHITTDFELTLQAARAITAAPGWLAGLKDADLLARVEKMKVFLRDSKPRNDYEHILRLQLASTLPDLVTEGEAKGAMVLLSQKQHPDGGWSLRDMSATDNWRTPMSEFVLKLIPSLPDAARPESDPYMTAFAIVLMRQNNVPAKDGRIQRGIAWLKREQRVSGRWWMHSLYRGNYHYITYIATAQAMKALALCGELDVVKDSTVSR